MLHPRTSPEIDDENHIRKYPGRGVAEAENEERMEMCEDGYDPDNPEQTDPETDDDKRADRVAGTS